MATATATFTINPFPDGKEATISKEHLYGTVPISPSPATYVTNGLPISFAGSGVYEGGTVVWAEFYGILGYTYSYDKAHGTIRCYLGGTEISNGATIPANVSGDTIQAHVVLDRN